MPFINANNMNLYYEIEGKGHPLLLIAGFTADSSVWHHLKPYLIEKFQVITLDNRGVGQSDAPDYSYTVKDMAEDAASLLQALNIQSAHVIGQSMGTTIAETLAVTHSELIDKIILANGFVKLGTLATLVFDNIERLIDANAPGDLILGSCIPWCYSEYSLSQLENHTALKERIDYMYHHPHPQSVVGYKRQLQALKIVNTASILNKLKQPCLIIAGENDFISPVSDSEALAELIPQSKLVVIKNRGHIPHSENPKEFSEIVLDFL